MMASSDKSREEWMAEEEERLKQGFTFEPPASTDSASGAGDTGDQVLAGLGLGAGVLAGAVAPHSNPVTFEGCRAAMLAEALRAELVDEDTRIQANQSGDSLVVTVLQSRNRGAVQFLPALAVTMVETGESLTVTLSELTKGAMTDALGSIGGTLLEHGTDALIHRPAGIGGLINTVGHVVQGAGEVADALQDMKLPKRTWAIIDRVALAAEQAYLDERRKAEAAQRKRDTALRSWTHCDYCGRAYEVDEAELSNCPACRGPRGTKPGFAE